MILLSGATCVLSHSCRLMLREKDIECHIEYISASSDPARLGEHNPYGQTPTLIDRDLSLYKMTVIAEYLDERFPHPPLMPIEPFARAKTRLTIARLLDDWLEPLAAPGEEHFDRAPDSLRKNLRDGLIAFESVLADQAFLAGDEYSLADTYIAPLLWRLPLLGLELPKQATAMLRYQESLLSRPAFRASLSAEEAELNRLPD